MFNSVRVRFAPSPSGDLHLGNLFIGKFNLMFSSNYSGALVLRIEDTDFVTSEEHCLTAIELTLNEFKLNPNESPIKIGYFGPYRQSERNHIYKFYGNALKSLNRGFLCKCSFKRIEALKRVNLALGDAAVYDGKCLKRLVKDGKLRLKVPRIGYFTSAGRITRWAHVDMQTLSSKTKPSFHLANVVDDHSMRISHVIRGNDWLNEIPKHILIYLYLGFSVPKFLFLPLLYTSNGKKLSKRNSALGLNGLIDVGIFPEAIDSYVTSLIKGNGRERLNFKPKRLQVNKNILTKFNKQVLRKTSFDNNELLTRKLNRSKANQIVRLCAQKSTTAEDVHRLLRFMFHTKPHGWYCKLPGLQYALLGIMLTKYRQLRSWSVKSLEALHRGIATKLNVSIRTLSIIIASATLGARDSVSLYEGFVLLGKEAVNARIMLYMRQH
ncbi:MAG: glutamate--tRNA ligase [Candidatus Hodgkinia cicadicola]